MKMQQEDVVPAGYLEGQDTSQGPVYGVPSWQRQATVGHSPGLVHSTASRQGHMVLSQAAEESTVLESSQDFSAVSSMDMSSVFQDDTDTVSSGDMSSVFEDDTSIMETSVDVSQAI